MYVAREIKTSHNVWKPYMKLKNLHFYRFHCYKIFTFLLKVEKVLKGSLDLIPSPSSSVKIQIMGGKVYLR